jgi:hypothetical protein
MIKVLIRKNRCKCCWCHSTLKYEPEDLEELKYTDGEIAGYMIKCPVCKGETRVSYIRGE